MMKPTISFCVIVKPTDEEAIVLERLLKDVHKYVDEICITITGRNQNCEAVSKRFGAKLSFLEWKNDFVAARNFNFKQATSDYIMWADCDDRIPKVDRLPDLLEYIAEHKIDNVILEYLYHFNEDGVCDVSHNKTRIVKNDQCVEWAGLRLHEDFRQLRELNSYFYEEIKIEHRTDDKRLKDSKERNLRIAEEAFAENSDDSRSWWLLAQANFGAGNYDEAAQAYSGFIPRSSSEEEKFLAYIYVGDIYRTKRRFQDSLTELSNALVLRPWYPDAYFHMAQTYFDMGRFKHAKAMLIDGMAKEIPKYEIIVHNPRDYDYYPLMLLAKTYMQLIEPKNALKCLEIAYKIMPSKRDKMFIDSIQKHVDDINFVEEIYKKALKLTSKEEIKELIDSVPNKLKSHPAIMTLRNQHFIKTESSGKDVTIFCAHTTHEWAPDVATFVGGSEEAVMALADRWATSGWNVTVYCNCGYEARKVNGVMYRPWWEWNYRNKTDVTIIWRHPKVVDFDINSKIILIDLHDVIGDSKGISTEFNSERLKKITKIMVKSEAHKEIIQYYNRYEIPDDKFVVIPNGIDVEQFNKDIERDPYLLINTSSPDRSLETLLDLYEEVLRRLPEDIKKKVKLDWRYGWTVWDTDYASSPDEQAWRKRVLEKFEKLEKAGYLQGGDRLPQEAINELYLKAGAFLYPTQFYEIHCISAAKAQAAGCVPIVANTWALRETVQYGEKINVDGLTKDSWQRKSGEDFGIKNLDAREAYIKATVKYLTLAHHGAWRREREEMSRWAKGKFDWDLIADQWTRFFHEN